MKGLKNKGNDCWLNSLIQCINVLNINLPESENFVPDPVACALKSVLNRLNRDTKSPFYPQELHNVFRTHFGYVKGRQHDIHESYTSLLSQTHTERNNRKLCRCISVYKKHVQIATKRKFFIRRHSIHFL